MRSKSGLSALVLAVGIVAGGAVPAFAHGPGQSGGGQPFGWHQGWHMGPIMGQGQMPMVGPGQMPMMGQAQMPMMGQAQMPMMGRAMMQPLAKDLCLANSYYVYKSPLFHRLVNPGGNGAIWVHA